MNYEPETYPFAAFMLFIVDLLIIYAFTANRITRALNDAGAIGRAR
jgi:hypothetical protein